MVKKAIIEVFLVPEALGKSSEAIELEIMEEFREGFLRVPYGDRIVRVKVVNDK